MSLPQFKNSQIYSEPMIPIYSNLFEIKSNGIDPSILDSVYGYEIDAINKTFSLDINLLLQHLKLLKQVKTNRIDIHYKDPKGEIVLKRTVYDLLPLGYSSKGNYEESNELLKIRLSWKFNDLFSFPE